MSTVFLFAFREYVQLVQTNGNPSYINWPMITYDTKVYKGVTNTIDFVVRNNERRPINLNGLELQATIQNQANGEILLTKTVNTLVALQGKAQLILDPGDIEDWPANYYDYVIQATDVNGIQTLMYTDLNKDTTGTFQLFDGVLRTQLPATEILQPQFTQTPLGNNDDIMYLTGAYPGDAQSQRANGMHTVAVYQTKWYGKFFIQASLTVDSPLPNEWFYVPLAVGQDPMYTFDSSNNQGPGPTLFNFSGNYYWVRFGYIPIWSPLVGNAGELYPNPLPAIATTVVNDGIFDKVLYKS
jgi:hypothetical protein